MKKILKVLWLTYFLSVIVLFSITIFNKSQTCSKLTKELIPNLIHLQSTESMQNYKENFSNFDRAVFCLLQIMCAIGEILLTFSLSYIALCGRNIQNYMLLAFFQTIFKLNTMHGLRSGEMCRKIYNRFFYK